MEEVARLPSLPAYVRVFCCDRADHMNKEQKTEQVEQTAAQLQGAAAIYAVDYRGLTVTQAAELRSNLREAGTIFRVVKNTLTLRAADRAGVDSLKPFVQEGPTALEQVRNMKESASPAAEAEARPEPEPEAAAAAPSSEPPEAEAEPPVEPVSEPAADQAGPQQEESEPEKEAE